MAHRPAQAGRRHRRPVLALARLARGVTTVALGLAGGFVLDNAADARGFGLFASVFFGVGLGDQGFLAFADFLLKLGVVTGNGLYKMGARMRGESYEQFLATRNDAGAT